MIPVAQTKFGRGGNCFPACVASMLEMKLEDVPDFCNVYPNSWFVEFACWLKKFGLTAILWKGGWGDGMKQVFRDTPLLACGNSPYHFGIKHQVIHMNGVLIHDPIDEGLGLEGEPEDWIAFVCIDPSKVVKEYEEGKNKYKDALAACGICLRCLGKGCASCDFVDRRADDIS